MLGTVPSILQIWLQSIWDYLLRISLPGFPSLTFITQTGRKDPLCLWFQDEKMGKRRGSQLKNGVNQDRKAMLPVKIFCFPKAYRVFMMSVKYEECISDGNKEIGRDRKEEIERKKEKWVCGPTFH